MTCGERIHFDRIQLFGTHNFFKCILCQRPFTFTFIYVFSFCLFTFLIMKINILHWTAFLALGLSNRCNSKSKVLLSSELVAKTNQIWMCWIEQKSCRGKPSKWGKQETRKEWRGRGWRGRGWKRCIAKSVDILYLWLLSKLKINFDSVTS